LYVLKIKNEKAYSTSSKTYIHASTLKVREAPEFYALTAFMYLVGVKVGYELTPAAEADLREIARYTLRQWGVRQQRRYARQLEACFQGIADGSLSSTLSIFRNVRQN
jgi:hypothetical protein